MRSSVYDGMSIHLFAYYEFTTKNALFYRLTSYKRSREIRSIRGYVVFLRFLTFGLHQERGEWAANEK